MSEIHEEHLRNDDDIEVSVVLPCLDEERTLPGCIDTIENAFAIHELAGEIIVADKDGCSSASKSVTFIAVYADFQKRPMIGWSFGRRT